MSVADATADFGVDDEHVRDRHDRAFIGHPKGLGYLVFAEACERFSYYSMQSLLVLYMVNYLLLPGHQENVIGLGWLANNYYGGLEGQPLASNIFGDYTALVYGTPIIGGLLADRFLGRRLTIIIGGVLMALGHFLMAFEPAFLFALLALVLGVGCFKGNIASQVGALYGPSDLRRAMAFQIFYIFINVSVIAAPLISGTLGEKVGWHWGFGTAGIVMVIGLAIYLSGQRWLPSDAVTKRQEKAVREKLSRSDWTSVLALLILIPVMAVALLTNQQIFNAYLIWGDQQFNLSFFGFELPTTWLVTLDAALSFLMLVAVAAFWSLWGRKRREPDELTKIIIGSGFSIAGGLCLVAAAAFQLPGEKIGLFWPFMFHLLNSIGFAHMLPITLALFSRLAPSAISATVIGLYYLAFFLGNKLVGKVGELFSTMDTVHFWLIHVGSAALAGFVFILYRLFLWKRLVRPDGAAPAPTS